MVAEYVPVPIMGLDWLKVAGEGSGYMPLSRDDGGNIGSSHRLVSGSVTKGMYCRQTMRPGLADSRWTRYPACVACRTEYRRRTQSGTTRVVFGSSRLVYWLVLDS